jgi:hypothetical protein
MIVSAEGAFLPLPGRPQRHDCPEAEKPKPLI